MPNVVVLTPTAKFRPKAGRRSLVTGDLDATGGVSGLVRSLTRGDLSERIQPLHPLRANGIYTRRVRDRDIFSGPLIW